MGVHLGVKKSGVGVVVGGASERGTPGTYILQVYGKEGGGVKGSGKDKKKKEKQVDNGGKTRAVHRSVVPNRERVERERERYKRKIT